jgi:hypothetical protein
LGTKSLAPLADDLARRIEASRDDLIGEALGREQDDLGADDLSIR